MQIKRIELKFSRFVFWKQFIVLAFPCYSSCEKNGNIKRFVEIKLYAILSVILKLLAIETITQTFFQYTYTSIWLIFLQFHVSSHRPSRKYAWLKTNLRWKIYLFGAEWCREKLCVIDSNFLIKFYYWYHLYSALLSFGTVGISHSQT